MVSLCEAATSAWHRAQSSSSGSAWTAAAMRRRARTACPANTRVPPALIIDQYLLTRCVCFETTMKRGARPRATRVARGPMASEPAHDEESRSGKKNEEHPQPDEIKRGNVGRNDR